ncbi:hypothetical protein M413DRAFT_30668 [Hebeloma cylindrosporum]|uniref:F-box domain-containing protein n=1 Tax=Hebeloma cylindrosporum TaxID=76867 RepID=A0A0C2Y9N8_HEBCY|nr:hypothetical protein M413DRAFT_30668 [Hebeloma cylindrosporum h7]
MGLLDFAAEILVEIFSNLHLRDLFACYGTCHRFHQLFTNSSYLQYRIELQKAGMIDNPFCRLPTPKKVEMLRERERAWSNFDWKFIKAKKVRSTASPTHGLTANEIFLGMEGRKEEFVTTGIQYLKLPSIVGGAVTSASWTRLAFGEEILEFGSAAMEHDLLVLSRLSTPTEDHPLPVILIDFRHHSDPRKPHKSASIPVIKLSYEQEQRRTPILSIEIAGENMAVLVMIPGLLVIRLHIFNWKLGIEKTVDPFPIYCERVTFLTDDLLLIPNSLSLDSKTPTLNIYRIPSSSAPIPAHIRLVQTLDLPTIKPSTFFAEFWSHSAPDPTHRSAFPPHFPNTRPFLSDPESAIVTLSFRVTSVDNDDDSNCFVIVVHKKALVDLVPLDVDDGASAPPTSWEAWGPPVTRWFKIREFPNDFPRISWGQRYVQCTASAFLNRRTRKAPRTITLYDFNPWRVRYVHWNQDQIQVGPVLKNHKLSEIRFSREDPLSHAKSTQNEGGDRAGLLEDVCFTNKFTSTVVGRLPCVAYSSTNWPEYEGVFIDDERLIGIYTEKETYRVNKLETIYFG